MILTKTKINKGINDKINEALNYVYNNKFSDLINIDSNSTATTNLNFNIGTIYYYDSKAIQKTMCTNVLASPHIRH